MIIKEIINRRSVRKFKNKEIKKADLMEIIKAAQFAPSAKHNAAVEFIIIKDQTQKNKLFDIVGQDFIKEAPILIVPVTDNSKTNCPIQDISVATMAIFLQATNLKLGSVWKNISIDKIDSVKKLLNIPDNFSVINILPLGYPDEKISPHTDAEFSEKKIHYEKY